MTKRPNPLDRYALDIAPGELTWIGVRPKRREPLQSGLWININGHVISPSPYTAHLSVV